MRWRRSEQSHPGQGLEYQGKRGKELIIQSKYGNPNKNALIKTETNESISTNPIFEGTTAHSDNAII